MKRTVKFLAMKKVVFLVIMGFVGIDSQAQKVIKLPNFNSGKAVWFVRAGAGVWIGHFNLDFTWQRGFVSIYKGDSEFFNNSFLLRIGYAF